MGNFCCCENIVLAPNCLISSADNAIRIRTPQYKPVPTISYLIRYLIKIWIDLGLLVLFCRCVVTHPELYCLVSSHLMIYRTHSDSFIPFLMIYWSINSESIIYVISAWRYFFLYCLPTLLKFIIYFRGYTHWKTLLFKSIA